MHSWTDKTRYICESCDLECIIFITALAILPTTLYLTNAGDGACTQSHSAYFVCTAIALYTARPRPEGEEQACEFRKFLYRAV